MGDAFDNVHLNRLLNGARTHRREWKISEEAAVIGDFVVVRTDEADPSVTWRLICSPLQRATDFDYALRMERRRATLNPLDATGFRTVRETETIELGWVFVGPNIHTIASTLDDLEKSILAVVSKEG